jgi:hypothetical protein
VATFKSSSNIIRKWNLQPISNIQLFPTHIESELGMLGIAEKLVKDIVHLWKRNFENN